MKKIHSIHLLLAAAALLLATAACTMDELADGNRLPKGQNPLEIASITISVEGGEAQPWSAPQTRVSEIADGTGSVFAVQIDGEEEGGTYTVQDDNTVKPKRPYTGATATTTPLILGTPPRTAPSTSVTRVKVLLICCTAQAVATMRFRSR